MNSFCKTGFFLVLLTISKYGLAEEIDPQSVNSNIDRKQPETIIKTTGEKKVQVIDKTPKPFTKDNFETQNRQLQITKEIQKKSSITNNRKAIPTQETTTSPSAEQKPEIQNTMPPMLPVESSQPNKTTGDLSIGPEIIESTTSLKKSKPTKTQILDKPQPPSQKQEQEKIDNNPSKVVYSDNKEKGLAIIMEVDRRDIGWEDSQANLKMILKNRHGDEHTRTLRMKTMEVEADGDKSLSIFGSPRDIKGTAFLSFTHALVPDEQWLYLPALKRVKRISSRNKSGPYLGSEFAFEDLSSFEVKKYSYNYLRDETHDGIDCFVIEAIPEYKHSGYKKTVIWIDKQRYILLKTDYYDRKNSLLKTQTFLDFKQYLNQYWRPDEMLMVNHTNGKSTKLIWDNYKFRNGFTKRNFDKNTLKRAR